MKKMLFKIFVTCFILVTFFSINLNVFAANFKYSDFDWTELLEQNKNYWVSSCDEGDENCYDSILKTQEKFYTQLYKLLAQYEKKGLLIKDSTIIETVFFGLTPNSFKDPVEGENNPYNIDEDINSYIASDDGNLEGAKEYFNNEKNSLKNLLNNMVGYLQPCYGISSEKPVTNEGITSCPNNLIVDGDICIEKLDDLKATFLDVIIQGFNILFGNYKSESDNKCMDIAKQNNYNDFKLGNISSTQMVDEDLYWEYLENSNYFDKKDHLQSYFEYVLAETDHNSMAELTPEEYEKYKEDIIYCRSLIIQGIKSVLETYKNDLSDVSMQKTSQTSIYWWPIGSSNVTNTDGKNIAKDDPESVNIINKYGLIVDRETNTEKIHYGIDISGSINSTNVIAVKEGVVVKSTKSENINCQDNGDKLCGSGYGNHIIIQHIDGNYTVYAHLAENSINVANGESVKEGQVIGKVGQSGDADAPYLHFEVRIGGNDQNSAQDPLNYISSENPRGGQGEIIIPDEYGNAGFFTYTKITNFNWVYNQKKVYDLWLKSGAKSKNHIAVIDDRYLIACTTTFGNIGDKIDFYLGDGTKIETIMFDAKSQESVAWDRNPANKWGHNGGQQIIEFEITHNPNNSGDVGSWTGWSGQRVASATNLNENIIN